MIELLENAYGLDLDVLAEIYGDTVFDGTNETSRQTIARWLSLCEALASKDEFLVVADSIRAIVPECYGFGAETRYKSKTMLAIVHDPSSARIVSGYDETGNPYITLSGNGVYRDQTIQQMT